MDNWTTTTSTSSSSSSIESNVAATAADPVRTIGPVTVPGEQEQEQSAVTCRTEPVSSITPPPQPRTGQPPARIRRRVRRRRRTGPRGLIGSSHRRLFQNISQEGNQTDEAITTDANISSTSTSNPTHETTNVSSTTTIPLATTATTRGNLAVRALFRDPQQQQQLLQQVISGRVVATTGHSGLNTGTNLTSNYSSHHCDDTHQNNRNYLITRPINNRQSSVSIVEANRRLIERQIEAIRQADSNRWNFDFRNCRPLNQIGHRYVGCTTTSLVTENSSDINYNNNNTININTTPNMSNANQTPSQPATGQLRNIKPLNDKNQTQDH